MKADGSVLRTPAAVTRIRIPAFFAPLRSVLNERHWRSAPAYILIRVSPSDVNVPLRVNTQSTLPPSGTFIVKSGGKRKMTFCPHRHTQDSIARNSDKSKKSVIFRIFEQYFETT